jgi:hypothetical protein
MQLNPPSERDAGVTNVLNARYIVEKYRKQLKSIKNNG